MTGDEEKTSQFYRLPIIPLLIFFLAGLTAGRFSSFDPFFYICAWICASAAFLKVISLLANQKTAFLSPLLLFAALGFLSIFPWKHPFFPPAGTADLLDSGYLEIYGRVCGPPKTDSLRTRCILDRLKIKDKTGALHQPGGRIQVSFYGSLQEPAPGDRLEFRAKLKTFKNFNNPKGFDYKQYMADQKTWASAYANSKTVKIYYNHPDKKNLQDKIANLRIQIDKTIASVSQGSLDATAVLSALVVGVKGRIPEKIRQDFNKSGVSHLLAISGLHIGIIAGLSYLIFNWMARRIKFLLYTNTCRSIAAVLALFPVIIYALLSGMSPSTQRALVMATVFLGAVASSKPYHSLNTLAAAALTICVIYPPTFFSVSFQLSFAAVGAIFFGFFLFPPKPKYNKGMIYRIAANFKNIVLISAFAIAGTLPLVMHFFHHASVLGLFANIIMIPWIGFVVLPAGLTGAMTFAFCPDLAKFLFSVASQILEPAISVIRITAKSPVGIFHTFSPTILEIICIYCFIGCTGLFFSKKDKNIRKVAAGGLVIVLLISSADIAYWIHRRFLHTDLRITVLDVGQGHCSLVELPGGKTMLIDGGGFSDNTIFDVGQRIVAPYLRALKIGTIDTIVLSHPDADHLNGLLYILKNFRTTQVLSNHRPADTQTYRQFLKIMEKKKIHHPPLGKSERVKCREKTCTEIIYPWPDPETICTKCQGANNCSLVIRLSHGKKSVLFPADIEKCAEQLIINNEIEIKSDVLISPHHASSGSSSDEFLDAVDPQTVIIPVRQGRYDLPSGAVIDKYQSRNYKILRTDLNGAVQINIDDNNIKISPKIKNPAGQV
jgi:competence protein ComEC